MSGECVVGVVSLGECLEESGEEVESQFVAHFEVVVAALIRNGHPTTSHTSHGRALQTTKEVSPLLNEKMLNKKSTEKNK